MTLAEKQDAERRRGIGHEEEESSYYDESGESEMNESEFAASQLSDGVISNNLAAQSSHTYKTAKSKKSTMSKKSKRGQKNQSNDKKKGTELAVIPEFQITRKQTLKQEERIATKVSKDESVDMDDDFSDTDWVWECQMIN